ncbi:NADH-quinone oxidoreductase subunit NuoG [Methylomonas sp. AM2-LC]|uniref:NADH-quinone oxidoreductase subunit NuoG n=1 Tax=Methylomonas sp. AM2-LC TaxID=3153301 RepID=UPI003266EE31
MARIEIDTQSYEVKQGDNLLAACLALGLDLPYFCWHPAMGSAGACRQCAIIQYKDAEDQHGRLVMACMTPVTDGLRISVAAEQAQQFRSANIELLMTNHPHDCPVCEEGGECHLQDMTVMTGHTVRRYRGKKRTHQNQNLGPFINHEMNRCIACYRCVRFYNDYAGGEDLQVFGMHNNVYFGRFADGALENEFSGNLVEVCPTGVFTDKTFSDHYARKWDLQTAPSICVHCSLGCNISPGERYGTLRRVVNRYNSEVNGYFLCDRGRFGYGFVNSPERIRSLHLNSQQVVTAEIALQHFRQLVQSAKGIIGIGSPRASLEANFSLRSLVGADNFFLGLDDTEHSLLNAIAEIMLHGGIHSPALHETERADAVLILGEDVTNSAPRLALSLRQAVRNEAFAMAEKMHLHRWQDAAIRQLPKQIKSPLYIAAVCATRLDDVARATYHGSPEHIARLGFAIAHYLDNEAPAPTDLSTAECALAASIAAELKNAKNPLVVSGISCSSLAVIQAAYQVAKALPGPIKQLTFTLPECNSLGLALMGGQTFQQALTKFSENVADTVVILENDLYRRASSADVDLMLESATHIIVIDSLKNQTTEKADLLLSAAVFAESEGTLVNNEGRAQRYFPVYPATASTLASWQWLTNSIADCQWSHFDALTTACAANFPTLAGIARLAMDSEYVVNANKIPRQSQRYSGRTAMHANTDVRETAKPQDNETPFAFSMEGGRLTIPPAWLPIIWAPRWNSNQAINKFQTEISGPLRGGELGIRLIEATGDLSWFTELPSAEPPQPGIWRIMQLPHIFGSDELSRYSLPIVERLPLFCALLHPQDAEALAVDSGDPIRISDLLAITHVTLPVQIENTLARGLLGITTGQSDSQFMKTGALVTVTKVYPAQQADAEVS